MYPLTCPNGKDHSFEPKPEDSNQYVCTDCGIDYPAYETQKKKIEELKGNFKSIVDYTNGGDPQLFSEALYEVMRETHRTLQQNYIRSMIAFFTKMQQMPTDPRNEACVEWCKDVSKLDRYLPTI